METVHRRGRLLVLILAVSLFAVAAAQGTGGASYVASTSGYAGPARLVAGWNVLTLSDGLEQPVGMQVFRVMGKHDDAELVAAIAGLVSTEDTPAEKKTQTALLAITQPLGGPTAVPGHPGKVWLKLDPGNYVFASTDEDANHTPLVTEGLYQRVAVTSGDTGEQPPQAAYQAKLVDFDIELPRDIKPGVNVWHIVDQGAEPHLLAIFRLAPGKTPDDLKAALSPQAASAPPPGQFVLMSSALSPGTDEYAPVALAPGDYVALCFVTDPLTGKPHFMLGMFVPFSVGG